MDMFFVASMYKPVFIKRSFNNHKKTEKKMLKMRDLEKGKYCSLNERLMSIKTVREALKAMLCRLLEVNIIKNHDKIIVFDLISSKVINSIPGPAM
jgi:hypothetical protein